MSINQKEQSKNQIMKTQYDTYQPRIKSEKEINLDTAKFIRKYGFAAVAKMDQLTKEWSIEILKRNHEELSEIFPDTSFSFNINQL